MAKQVEEKKHFRFSEETLNLPCEWEDCSVVKDDIQVFISHVLKEHLIHLDGGDLHCHWKDCEGFTENLPELRRHILQHAFHAKIKCYGENLQIRKHIPNCTLSNHSRNIIPELPDPLVCCWENCATVFECPEHYYRHADYHAEYDSQKEKSFICLWNACQRSFHHPYKLREHMRSHTQEKLVACPTCGGMFASRTKFFDHIQRQLPVDDDEDGSFICEYCSRKMSSERLLRDHMRHHVNNYKCPYCDMTCPTPSGIQVHVAYRHSENKPHACHFCDYRCKSETDLRKHLVTHTLTSTYPCPAEGCSYATRSPSCFNAHFRKQHEKKEQKYVCHLCEKMFTRGNYLTKHLLNHHKFRWPSGHCRFRYRLHPDGYFRLQTVRYESLELSQAMMGENSESIDDPENFNPSMQNSEETNVLCNDGPKSLNTFQQVIQSNTPAAGSVVFCLDNENITFQEGNPISSSSYQNTFFEEAQNAEQEPVLIKIVDSVDGSVANSSSGSVILMDCTDQDGTDTHPRAVQVLTKDAEGRMVLETAEIVTQYDPKLFCS